MKIFFGQIYIQAGVAFPFTLTFQKWLSQALSEKVDVSKEFSAKYDASYNLGIRISAKREIDNPEIKGPTVYKREKTVEYSIFLPHKEIDYHDQFEAKKVVEQLLRTVMTVLRQLDLNDTEVSKDIDKLLMEFSMGSSFIQDTQT